MVGHITNTYLVCVYFAAVDNRARSRRTVYQLWRSARSDLECRRGDHRSRQPPTDGLMFESDVVRCLLSFNFYVIDDNDSKQ